MTSNSEESLFPPGWWKKSPEDYAEARAALKSLAQKDLEGGTKDQIVVYDKYVPRVHPVIANLYKIIGEERAAKAIQSLKPTASTTAASSAGLSVATPGGSSSVTLASPGIGTTPVSVSKPPVSAKKKKTATIVTPKLVCTKAGLKMKQVKQKLQFEEDTESEEELWEESTTPVKNSELDRMFALLTLGDEILMNRLFILQVAAEDGWQVAKEVSLYQAGKYRNQYYQKAIEKKEKRERDDKRLKERLLAQRAAAPARRGYHSMPYRTRGSMAHHGYGNRRMDDRQNDRSTQSHASGPGDRVKCYNCQGFGHLARDCYNKPAAAGAPHK